MIFAPLMRFRTFTGALIAGVAIALAVAPATTALTIYQLHGRPGRTIMAAIEGVASSGAAPQITVPLYAKGGIYRSSASRAAQRICVRFRVWVSSDSTAATWHVASTWPMRCAWTKRGHRFRPRTQSGQVEAPNQFRVTAQITWRTRKRLLGSEVLDYDNPADYYCASTRCSIQQASDGRAFLYLVA